MLERVSSPADLKHLGLDEMRALADEMRALIIKTCAERGGHIAPSLGVVELTIALHRVFDSPHDAIIWDVGHQSYAHKILTGRRDRFGTLRTAGGLSGFTRRGESPHDPFGAGHASTSLGAAIGLALADKRAGNGGHVVAVFGDGALTGGVALEALNFASNVYADFTFVLNDNERSISENVGGMSKYLSRLISNRYYNRLRDDVWKLMGKLPREWMTEQSRTLASKIEESLKNLVVPTIIFEDLGFRYVGPVDGHNLKLLTRTFEAAKRLRGPVFVHVITKKGKGYEPAERDPERFHGIGPFDVATGATRAKGETYTDRFGKVLVEMAEEDPDVFAVTAAMPTGTGLKRFKRRFPKRFLDVGIAEQLATLVSAALSTRGFKPFCAVYSTFLQRAFDQIIHDIALQGLPVRLVLDRAGLVGEDGPTHHGPFDLSYMRLAPGFTVTAPRDGEQLAALLNFARRFHGPISIRYPRDRLPSRATPANADELSLGRWETFAEGTDVAVVATGSLFWPAHDAAERLADKHGVSVKIVNAPFIKPLDTELLDGLRGVPLVLTVEENVLAGGFGSAVREHFNGRDAPVITGIGLPDAFVPHGKRSAQLAALGLDEEGLLASFEVALRELETATHARG